MAGITEGCLRLCQQEFGRCGLVDRMAVGANDICFRMWRPPDVGARDIFRVAIETSLQCFPGSEVGESADGRFSTMGRDMIPARSVATLTSSLRGRFFAQIEAARR